MEHEKVLAALEVLNDDAAIESLTGFSLAHLKKRVDAEVGRRSACGQVVVYVSGGVVQDVACPPGVEVEVRDYDNAEGLDADDVGEDGRTKCEGYDWEYGVDDQGGVYQIARY